MICLLCSESVQKVTWSDQLLCKQLKVAPCPLSRAAVTPFLFFPLKLTQQFLFLFLVSVKEAHVCMYISLLWMGKWQYQEPFPSISLLSLHTHTIAVRGGILLPSIKALFVSSRGKKMVTVYSPSTRQVRTSGKDGFLWERGHRSLRHSTLQTYCTCYPTCHFVTSSALWATIFWLVAPLDFFFWGGGIKGLPEMWRQHPPMVYFIINRSQYKLLATWDFNQYTTLAFQCWFGCGTDIVQCLGAFAKIDS